MENEILLARARDVGVVPRDLAINGRFLPEDLLRRCRHVVSENARVLATVDALQRGDLPEVGRLFYASHESLARDYEVSSPELDLMVELACSLEGVGGGRLPGGGARPPEAPCHLAHHAAGHAHELVLRPLGQEGFVAVGQL